MKARYLFFIFLAVGAFYLSSCQKELSNESGSPQGFIDSTNVSDSNYLSKILTVSIENGIKDTGTKVTYTYDNLKRVSLISTISHTPYSNDPDAHSNLYFFYNASDTFPQKSIQYYSWETAGFSEYDTLTTFYHYNGTGKLISDSSIDGYLTTGTSGPDYSKYKEIRTFTYSGVKTYIHRVYDYLSGLQGSNAPDMGYDTLTSGNSGNIISASKKRLYNTGEVSYNTAVFTYDNKPSPIYRVNVKPILSFFNYSYYTDVYPYLTIGNNIISISEDAFFTSGGTSYPQSITENYTGHYSYKANGFPFSLNDFDLSQPASYVTNQYFIYRSL